ncbi:DUF4265 domain-containing protein [Micromonospora sp. WMMD1120]|uniref:DUF4265 domain-containing protein n=1 Tax=Micromonospora sp. WMMD1120 TaxID=3016106 RepID=UPI002415CFFF|nr:DUF4265 domain-containing protein [Micromonospora sp. WMMD1120]MDG4809325.1 DUF4265 domain-containing protein [Micromonospora sp. WMMD1120]
MGAQPLAPDRVRLPSAPWAKLNAAKGDIFRVQRDEDGQLWVREKLEASGYCAIRVTLAPGSPLGPLDVGTEAILERFSALGIPGTGMFGVTAIDVPPNADLRRVRHLLDTGKRYGWWGYDELCVTEAWRTVVAP